MTRSRNACLTGHRMERTYTMTDYEHDTVDREAETAMSLDEASTVPRDEQTEARPHLLTLYYPTNTPASFTDKFPKQRLRKQGNQAFEMGRGQTVDVLLNDTHMPRSFVEINCAVHPEDGPKWYIKNKSNKKPVRIVRNGVKSTLKHEEKQELVENCELKLESLTFIVRREDGDVGDLTEVELEFLPMENDSTNSSGSLTRSLSRQASSSDDSACNLSSASALHRHRAGSGPAAMQTTIQNGVAGVQLPGNCFGLPLTGHGALPGSTPVHQLTQLAGNASAAGSQCSTYCPSHANTFCHNFQHPGSQYSHPQINHIMNLSTASSQVSHLTSAPQANMMVNPTASPGYAVPGSGPPGHYLNPGVGYPTAGGYPQVMNQHPYYQGQPLGVPQFPNHQPLAQNGGHSQMINQPPSNQAGFSQVPNQQSEAQNQFPGAPSFNRHASVNQQQAGLPVQQPPAPGHPTVYTQDQNQLHSHQPSLRPGVVEPQQMSTPAVNIFMTGVPHAMPELQGTSLQPTTSALNYPELSRHAFEYSQPAQPAQPGTSLQPTSSALNYPELSRDASDYSQHLLWQHAVTRTDPGQNPPQPLHGPLSLPLSTLASQTHRQLPPSHDPRSQGQHHPLVHAVQPESAMHIQQQPRAPPIISAPTPDDRRPQLYHVTEGGLPVAPPITQLEELKLGHPMQVTTAAPTEVSSTTPANSLSHSGGADGWNPEGGGGASVISLNPNNQLASRPSLAPGGGALHNGGAQSAPSATAATESKSPAVAVSSLTNPASNGNLVNLRVHEAVAATPPTSMGSLGVLDLALGLQQGHGSAGQGQGHGSTGQGQRSEGQAQSREPQENDDRQPQEHDDQES